MQNVQDNPAGQVTSRTLSSVVETRSFNTRNQVTGIAATAGASVLGLSYDYGTTNNNGRIRSRSDALQPEHSVNYSYDALNRLTQAGAVNGSWSIAWTLDSWGNRTAQTPGGLATSLVGSQTLGYSNNKNTLFSYDNAGHVTNDGLHNYVYDAEGRITSVDSGAVTFGYDTEGRRVKKTASSQTAYYCYGQTGLLSEFTTVNTGATQAQSTDRLNVVVSEQTGTPVLVLAGTGTVVENNRVLPFGELWSSETGSANDQKFTSYLRDSQSGLDYAMARYYTSGYGRFTSPDRVLGYPTDPQSWNRYPYAENDPMNFTDPDGLCRINGVEYPDGAPPCPNGTSVTTTTTPPPPGLSPEELENYCNLFPSACGRGPTIGPGPSTEGSTVPFTGSFFGIGAPGQTFTQCMQTNANAYSLGGFLELGLNVAAGKNTSYSSTWWGSFLAGNSINGLLFGSNTQAAGSVLGTAGTDIAATAIGTPLTYGRRTAEIMALNLVGTRGVAPRVLQRATAGASSALGTIGKMTNAGFSLARKIAIDTGFTLSEVIGCSLPQ